MKLLKKFSNIFRVLRIVSKYQIFTYSEEINFSLKFRILGWLVAFFFSPGSILKKPKQDFSKRIVESIYMLGPIYIKFAQTLSVRPDLIGDQFAKYLKSVQDSLPPFDSRIARDLIEKRFHKKIENIFANFEDKPVAAASIAQVHRAQLHSGEKIAIKILRPNIEENYCNDIEFLRFIAVIISKLFKKTKRLKLLQVINVFQDSMEFELDLRLEASAASRVSDNFLNDNILKIPQIYWDLTSKDILTLEWVEGCSIYDKNEILRLGLKPIDIAQKIAVIFLNQAYRDGFFHADLHPGNILLCKDGRIALVDFGIVGILKDQDRFAIAEILYSFLKRDYVAVAKIHKKNGYIPKNANIEHFAQYCRAIAEPIIYKGLNNVSIGNLLSSLFAITEKFGMETQEQLILLQKTMAVVEGIAKNLDKNANMLVLSESWIKKWAAKNLSPEAKLFRYIQKLLREICEL